MTDTDDVKVIEQSGQHPASQQLIDSASEWIRNVQAKTGWPNKDTSAIVRVGVSTWIFASPHELTADEQDMILRMWREVFPGHQLVVLHSTVYIPMEVSLGAQGPDHGQDEGRSGVPDRGDAVGGGRGEDPADGGQGDDGSPADRGRGADVQPVEASDPAPGGAGERGGSGAGGARPATRAEDQRRRRGKAKPQAEE